MDRIKEFVTQNGMLSFCMFFVLITFVGGRYLTAICMLFVLAIKFMLQKVNISWLRNNVAQWVIATFLGIIAFLVAASCFHF